MCPSTVSHLLRSLNHHISTHHLTSLQGPRTFSPISLALLGDISANSTDPSTTPLSTGSLLSCPDALTIYNTCTNQPIATRSPWTSCVTNAINIIDFDAGAVTTDEVSLAFTAKQYLTFAISETQIWVPAEAGPQYEAEDSLMGAFIGGFEGRFSGGNSSLVRPSYNATQTNGTEAMKDGGVVLGEGAWIEWAGIIAPPDKIGSGVGDGNGSVVVEGAGSGSVNVQLNFLKNVTVTFDGSAAVPNSTDLNAAVSEKMVLSADAGAGARENQTASGFEYLRGGNVVTVWQVEGMVFVDRVYVL